ncbi:MAG: hypothetical protein ACKOQ3_03225 [Novosphingobium sp.]
MLIIAPRRREARLWRRLGLAALRRRLSKRLRQPQPLEAGVTGRIARRNLLWHIALTMVMASQTAAGLLSTSPARQALGLVLVLPALAWLVGSLVQRHKLVLLAPA